jgi:hypothetical protein
MSENQNIENPGIITPSTAPITPEGSVPPVKKTIPLKLIAGVILGVVLIAMAFVLIPKHSASQPQVAPTIVVEKILYYVSGDRVRVRKEPNYTGEVLGYVNKGDRAEHQAISANVQLPWMMVTIQDQPLSGWVHQDFLKTKLPVIKKQVAVSGNVEVTANNN